jgi:hypothetical protein
MHLTAGRSLGLGLVIALALKAHGLGHATSDERLAPDRLATVGYAFFSRGRAGMANCRVRVPAATPDRMSRAHPCPRPLPQMESLKEWGRAQHPDYDPDDEVCKRYFIEYASAPFVCGAQCLCSAMEV